MCVCGNSVSKSIKRKGLLSGQVGKSGAAFEKILINKEYLFGSGFVLVN